MTNMNLMFFKGLFLSGLMALSTNNWFQLWLALELNMLFFIPVMFSMNNMSANSMMKYYIIQTIASSLFISMMIMSQKFLMEFFFNNIIIMTMSMKVGLFPVYFWYPQVSEGLSWTSFFILSTWQKIIPLYILSMSNKYLYPVIIFMSAMVGCLSMINQTSLRKIFAFSSLTHMSWMLLSMYSKEIYWSLYFFFYSMIMLIIFNIMKGQEMSNLNNLKKVNFSMNMKIFSTLMSLGGLPPLLGFFPKLLVLSTINKQFMWLLFFLIITSLVSMYVYMNMMFPMIFSNLKMKTHMSLNMNNNMLYSLNIMGLTPILFFIFM